MEQQIPIITKDDLKRIINREFPSIHTSEIERILNLYNSEIEEGRNRVQASVLKLSNGDISLLKDFIEQANNDFRNIIAMAEYPNYSKILFSKNFTNDEKQTIIDEDWIQYKSWLER